MFVGWVVDILNTNDLFLFVTFWLGFRLAAPGAECFELSIKMLQMFAFGWEHKMQYDCVLLQLYRVIPNHLLGKNAKLTYFFG